MIVVRVCAIGVLFLSAALMWRTYYAAGCAPLAIPSVATIFLLLSLREWSIWRRQCFAGCHFREGTSLRRLFSSPVSPTIFSTGIAVVLGIVVAVEIIVRPLFFLALLAADFALAALLLVGVAEALRSSVSVRAAHVIVKSWAVFVNALILLTALVAWTAYFESPPSWANADFSEMAAGALGTVSSSCPYTHVVLKTAMMKDAAAWWAILSSEARFGNSFGVHLRVIAWTAFLMTGAISAFAISRLIVEIVYRSGVGGARHVR